MHKLLLDVNVILDVAMERRPHHEASKKILVVIETKKAVGFLSAISCPILFYLLERELGSKDTKAYLQTILELFSIVSVDEEVLRRALDFEAEDFEDNIQIASAEKIKANFIITRDATGYKDSIIPAITPAEYLTSL